MLALQMLYTKKDEVLVVLFGTADTENNVFTAIGGEDEDGPYSHIVDTTESFSTPDTTIVKGLARVPDSEHSVRTSRLSTPFGVVVVFPWRWAVYLAASFSFRRRMSPVYL